MDHQPEPPAEPDELTTDEPTQDVASPLVADSELVDSGEPPLPSTAEAESDAVATARAKSAAKAAKVKAVADVTVVTEGDPADNPVVEPVNAFVELGLRPELLDTLLALGYEEPTPIQREAIPPSARRPRPPRPGATGTGKTAAFALPVLDRLRRARQASRRCSSSSRPASWRMQVSEAMYRYGQRLEGAGRPDLRRPAHRPPARRAAPRRRTSSSPPPAEPSTTSAAARSSSAGSTMVVLDEADEMLDMGFAEDLEAILEATPSERQTVLFSATMPPRISGIARRHLRDPVRIEIEQISTDAGGAPLVRQRAYIVPRPTRPLHSAAYSTSRSRRRRSSSAAPVARSTS